MKALTAFFVVLMFLTSTTFTYADYYDGYQLKQLGESFEKAQSHETLSKEAVFDTGRFMGYVTGIADGMDGMGFFCIPAGVKVGQVGSIVYKYLRDHPEKWNRPGSECVINALTEAFPCVKK